MTLLEQRQVDLEYSCVMDGQARYMNERERQGEAATRPGQEQARRCIPPLATAITTFLEAAHSGAAGRKHSAVPYLMQFEPEQAAYLTIMHALDAAASRKLATTCAVRLGGALRDHLNLLHMKLDDGGKNKGLYIKVIEQVKKATTERHRVGVLRHVQKKYNINKLQWTPKECLLLGMKLIELFEETSNLITLQRQTHGKSDTPIYMTLTPEAQEWFEQSHARASMWSPVHMPMLVPPRDWTTPFNGGYIARTAEGKVIMKGAYMVLSHTRGYMDELKQTVMPEAYSAINAIQRTPWKINKAVLDVMNEARSLGPRYESLLVEADEPIPSKPAGLPEGANVDSLSVELKEELLAWKARAAKTYEANARRRSNRVSLMQKLSVADRFANEEAIWFPHYLDFRGRVYPFANYLSPQGDDMSRALLTLANGKPLGERGLYWLQVHTANLFGVDKVSFADRVSWVQKNLDKLLACAASPLDNNFWTTADSPWSALAACFELAGAVVQGSEFVSHLPIAMDGSCSGLQHYSAMLRDPVGGAAVNLVPSAKPGDIYTQVANKAQNFIEDCTDTAAVCWKSGKVVRKIAKQPTMTLCYSATVFGMKGQIESAIRKLSEEKGVAYLGDETDPYKAAGFMAHVIWNAIGETVVAAKDAMAFLKDIARLAAKEGLPIRWTSPTGFPVVQEYRSMVGKRVEVHYAGKRIDLTLTHEGDKLDKKRQASGVAPNFIHSLDSAHLMATVNLGEQNDIHDWAVIHDSFGCHAADVDVLHACIREAFVEQYTPDVLQRFKEEIAEQLTTYAPELVAELPDVPAKGTLDLDAVRDAAYFFA